MTKEGEGTMGSVFRCDRSAWTRWGRTIAHSRSVALALLCVAPLLVLACVRCPQGMTETYGGCADRPTLNFIACTGAQGSSLTQEQKLRLEGDVGTAVRLAGAKGAVEVVNTVTSTTHERVALKVVEACVVQLQQGENTPPGVKTDLVGTHRALETQIAGMPIRPGSKAPPSVVLSPLRGKATAPITVTGRDWPENEEVEITGFAAQTLGRVRADGNGTFSTAVTHPALAGTPRNVTIRVAPVNPILRQRSPLMTQTALYEIVP